MSTRTIVIGIVGPCSAGKTTLINGLKERGFTSSHHIAQEHSFVPNMWQRMVDPDVLIYLDVSYRESMRRKPLDMTADEFEEQVNRLQHARQHANLYLLTDQLSPEQVLARVIAFLTRDLQF